jgi:hypothetical protein
MSRPKTAIAIDIGQTILESYAVNDRMNQIGVSIRARGEPGRQGTTPARSLGSSPCPQRLPQMAEAFSPALKAPRPA